jgi:mono/diheme cytochrome c family protein
MRPQVPFILLLLTSLSLTAQLTLAEDIDFASQIQPILAKRCYSCHGPDDQQGNLRFDRRDTLLVEAESGEIAIKPGSPDHSEMIKRVMSTDDSTRMPPEGKPLNSSEIDSLRAWIQNGAEYTKHWSFQPLTHPVPPRVARVQDALQPLDAFVLHKLEKAKVAWGGEAPPAVLIRRVYLDVTGLPPSPVELAYWMDQWNESTYERLVDQLLSNPSFGDRWARMWLDVVRYAESNSFERDNPKPNAWRYRDYVIQSFNSDKPYSQFIREQIAGDELDRVTTETLIATGYYRLGLWDDEPADPLQARFDEYDDIVTITSQAFLALTVNCARCHDHKIDPLTQKDYYSMVALVRDVTSYATRGDQVSNNQLDLDSEVGKAHRKNETTIKALEKKLRKMEQDAIVKMPAPDQRATEGDEREKVLNEKLQSFMDEKVWAKYQEMKKEFQELLEEKNALPKQFTLLGLAKVDAKPPATHVLLRGSPHNEGEEVQPAFPGLLGGGVPKLPEPTEDMKSPGRRRAFADWLASDDNWLTARVIVNRVWLHYFGRGIVRSPNNFGLMGDQPTHPELLDYLANELIQSGWSLKHVHRQILLSSTYRRGSQNIEQSLATDPANNLFWRQNLKRLSAEQVRDSVLHVSGQLNLSQFGPPMYPTLSAEVLASQSQPGRNWEHSTLADQAKRSIYIHVKRSLPVPMLSVFDFPETDTSCEARFLTVQPGQALTLMNSQWMQEQAQHLLDRAASEVGGDLEKQVARCLELVTSQPADGADVAELVSLVDRLKTKQSMPDPLARRNMALVALNLNQFIFVD